MKMTDDVLVLPVNSTEITSIYPFMLLFFFQMVALKTNKAWQLHYHLLMEKSSLSIPLSRKVLTLLKQEAANKGVTFSRFQRLQLGRFSFKY